MEVYGNRIKVQQGEDWNLDLKLSSSSREYIPYIVGSRLDNPYFVVTVASTKYEKQRRYAKSWWNNIDERMPRFYSTVVISYGEVELSEVSDPLSTLNDYIGYYVLANGFYTLVTSDNKNKLGIILDDTPAYSAELPSEPSSDIDDPTYGDTKSKRNLYQYTFENDVIDKSLGHKPYHYFYFTYNDDGECTGIVNDNYECRIRFNFNTAETGEWDGQTYLYQISLVSGQLMAEKLESIRIHYQPETWPSTIAGQYLFVKANYPNELQPDIDIDSPLGQINAVETILAPSKLEVYNNLRKLL